MGDRTAIEWTDATWNPIVGCSRCSPGCDHCYAIGVVHRGMSEQHVGLTVRPEAGPTDWTGEVRFVPNRLDLPLRWRRPRRIFVNSLSDLFHPEVLALSIVGDDSGRSPLIEILAVMVAARQHTFQVLTKRPKLMRLILADPQFRLRVNARLLERGYPVMPGGMTDPSFRWPAHIWWGVSIESNDYAWRADTLRDTAAGVRWISAEPLLGPLDQVDLTGIDWVIAGGESGPGARPMHPQWVRDLRDRCTCSPSGSGLMQVDPDQPVPSSPDTGESRSRAGSSDREVPGVPAGKPAPPTTPGAPPAEASSYAGESQTRTAFLFKQWGSWVTEDQAPAEILLPSTSWRHLGDDEPSVYRVGKREAGRMLDGRTWDEYPVIDTRRPA